MTFTKRFSFYALLFFSLFSLAACSGMWDVQPGNISSVKIKELHDGFILLDIVMDIENNSSRKVIVRNVSADIYINSTKAGTITTEEKLIMPPESDEKYSIPLKIQHENMGIIWKALFVSAFHNGRIDIEIKGNLCVRSWILFKNIHFDKKSKVPVFR